MPIYKNKTQKQIGEENLAIPPNTENFESIYYYNIPELEDADKPPFYNPIKLKQYIFHEAKENDSTLVVDLNQDIIGKDFFIHITTIKHIQNKLTDIELFFNNINNEPSLPLSSGVFCINNTNRIKKLIFIIKNGIKCELLIMVSDKFLIGSSGISYSNSVHNYGQNLKL